MLPVVAGPHQTKWQMLLYTLVLWPVTAAPWLLGVAGSLYGGGTVLLNAVFTGAAIQVCRDRGDSSARRMFALSLLYLFLIFSLLLLDCTRGVLH
jgi:protoheme IX farnesyltransferase